MASAAELGDVEGARALLDQMLAEGLVPSIVTHTAGAPVPLAADSAKNDEGSSTGFSPLWVILFGGCEKREEEEREGGGKSDIT